MYEFKLFAWVFAFLFEYCLWISVSELYWAGSVLPRCLHDSGAKAPHVHTTVWSSTIPHGPEGLSWYPHARARLPPHAGPDGSTAWISHDENAASACTQAHRGAQPAERTTPAAPAPAAVTAGIPRVSTLLRLWLSVWSSVLWLYTLLCNHPWGWHFGRLLQNE